MSTRPGKKHWGIWLTEDEQAAFLARAEEAGLSGADYFRKVCLKTPARRRRKGPDVKELHRLHAALNQIGNNLNQLAAAANAEGWLPQVRELEQMRTQLFDMADQLDRALGYDS